MYWNTFVQGKHHIFVILVVSFFLRFLHETLMIMQRCLLQLLSSKTVVYATHHLEFIEAADLVLVSTRVFSSSNC